MAERANVTSTEVLEDFRNQLIIYVSKARPALEEVSADALRARLWLENDQRVFLEGRIRRLTKELEMAQAALFSAKLGNLRDETAAEVMVVHRAKRSLEEAENKLRILKHWNREFEGRVQPLVKQMEKLHTLLSHDMVRAIASLNETMNKLAAYAQAKPPGVAGSGSPPAGPGGAPASGNAAGQGGQAA